MKLQVAALALALALFPQLASAVVLPGEVWSFGYNSRGQLGDNTTDNRNYALPVLGLSNVSAIGVTRYHSTALRNDGTVWAWGANGFGEVGDNTSTARYLPVQVTGPDGVGYLSGITSIATTRRSTIALRSDGTVWAWGWNPYGQLGDNTTTVRYAPVQVLGQDGAGYLTNITAIAAGMGGYGVFALRNDGTVWAWGQNTCGALGDNTTTDRLTPVQVLGPNGAGYLSDITSIATSGESSFAFRNDGTVWAWGCNAYGRLGDNTTTDSPVPVQMTVVSGIASIAAEASSTFVIRNDGSLWAWGGNNYGQLGINSSDYDPHPLPVQVLGPGGAGYLTNVTSVHAGDGHIIAIKNDGTAWAWGYNYWGQLGDGTNQDSALPTQVVGVTNVTAAAAGDVHSLVANTVPLIAPAIPTAGKAWTFGQNNYGQLGDGTTVDTNYPVEVTGISNISAIDSAHDHTVALRNDGTVWTWGFNSFGALGINSSDYDAHPVPAQVVGPEGTGYLTGITKIAAVRRGSLAIRNDGTVWAWGFNRWGQLGIGSSDTLPHPSPSQVLGPGGIGYLQNITAVDGGGWDYGVVALRGDGTVWTWGSNSYGSLGIGSSDTLPHPSPSQVLGPGGIGYLQNITAVSSGGYHILALRNDGTVWAWGWNSYGQLGDGTTADSYVPVQVSGLANVTAIDAAYDYSLALKSDGTVWAWGWNGNGQLGINSSDYDPHPLPVQVLGQEGIGYLADVAKIAAGRESPLALKSDGTVWSWGWNFYGQLGDGTNTDSSTPVRVLGLTSMTAIAAGQYHSIAADAVPLIAPAIPTAGKAWAFGQNNYGQLGDGTTVDTNYPVEVTGISNISAIDSAYEHTVALRNDGTVWTWGLNSNGELGINSSDYDAHPVPAQVVGPAGTGYLTGITKIAAVKRGSLAIRNDGTVWAWGRNHYGQLGDGTTADSYVPVQVSGLTNMTAVDGGGWHYGVVALRGDGTVWTWGANSYGSLGIGSSDNLPHPSPSQVLGPGGIGYLQNITAVSSEGYHILALRNDGTVWAWGNNYFGQLGNSSIPNRSTDCSLPCKSASPVQVDGLANVTAIDAAYDYSLALKSDGTVWSWGSNVYGQLGINSSDYDAHPLPVQVLGPGGAGYLTNVTSVHAGNGHIIAIKNDGTAWAWGYNYWGQLGDGTNTDSSTPVQVSNITSMTAIAAGQYHSIAADAVPLIAPAIPGAPAGANLTIETDDNYSSADLEGDVRSGTAIVYTVNESRRYSWLQTNYANSSVGMRFLNVSFTTASTLTLQNATVAITPPSKNLTYWSRAVNVTPAFNFTSYTMTFSRARPFESVFKCSSDCGNPASWAAVAGTLQDGNITVTLNETDPIIALGGSAYINVSMPSNFSATLGAPVASGAGFSIPVDPSQTYPLLSLMSLDGSYDFDFANVAPGYSSALSVAGVVPPIGPSVFGVDAWIAAINVSMDFNTSGYNVTFLGMQGKRAFKCASNCTEAASWTEVATQSAPGGMLLALAPGDPVILIGSSFGEEGGATKVAAPEADFLLVSLIFVVAVLGFVALAGKD